LVLKKNKQKGKGEGWGKFAKGLPNSSKAKGEPKHCWRKDPEKKNGTVEIKNYKGVRGTAEVKWGGRGGRNNEGPGKHKSWGGTLSESKKKKKKGRANQGGWGGEGVSEEN